MLLRSTLTAALWLAVLAGASTIEAQVSGTVVEAVTLTPLSGARVTLQATSIGTTTAADGTFSLPGVSGTGVVIVGAHKGYYNGGTSVTTPAAAVTLVLDPVPVGTNHNYGLLDPTDCGFCHPDQYNQWVGSPMADAGPNTWSYDIYDGSGTPGGLGGFVYVRDSVLAAQSPASDCAACHQPEAWLAQPGTPMLPLTSGSSFISHGISCEVCHKIAHVDVARMNYPGVHEDLVTFTAPFNGAGQVQYGLLGDTTFNLAGVMRASYQPQLAAEVCGTCHQDKNDPDGDGDFEGANGVISEPTYWEWKNSPYGDLQSPLYASCVDCHMPALPATAICNLLTPPLVREAGTVRSHEIRGTTQEFLENAVTMQVSAAPVGGALDVEVSIMNDQTGHHVPTGVTVRNMILLLDVVDDASGTRLPQESGSTIHALGGIGDPALGYYAGLPGRLYAKINHDAQGQGPTFFTEATGILSDNRIAPLATDTTQYSFSIPTSGGDLRVRARLIYRRAWRALVDAKQWQYDGHMQPLGDVNGPHFGYLMEEFEQLISVPVAPSTFRRADANGDGAVDVADPIFLLGWLFVSGSVVPACRDAADVNDSGSVDIADAVALLSHLFVPGAPVVPPPSGVTCGTDPTPDGLGCAVYPAGGCP